jgi:hypothetical protein
MRKIMIGLGCLVSLCSFYSAHSQTGLQTISEVTRIIEKDYPGYFILNTKQKNDYQKLKATILAQAEVANRFEVTILINEYLKFFNDAYLNSIYFKNDYHDSLTINIYDKGQKIDDEITGLWYIKRFDIILSIKKTSGRYSGFIYKDLNGFNKTGKKYLAIYPALGKSAVNFLFFDSDGISFSLPVVYKKGRFFESPYKVFMERITIEKAKTLKSTYSPISTPTIKKLTEEIIEVKIPALYPDYTSQIDSLLNVYDSEMKKAKTLIIDLRGNGGGGVLPTLALIKYIKTGPIHYINSFSIASDTLIENAKRSCFPREKDHLDYYNNYCNKFLANLMNNRGKMIFDSSELYENPEPPLANPKNVAIIIDNATASAAELFVLAAQQSKKVKVFGENSAGGVDFGGVVPYFLSDSKYALYLTTEMAEYIKTTRYDGKGITPDVPLSGKQGNWIREVMKFYRTK